MLIVGLVVVGLLLVLFVVPGWLVDRPRWSEQVEPLPVAPDGPRMLAALARRAGIDGSDT